MERQKILDGGACSESRAAVQGRHIFRRQLGNKTKQVMNFLHSSPHHAAHYAFAWRLDAHLGGQVP